MFRKSAFTLSLALAMCAGRAVAQCDPGQYINADTVGTNDYNGTAVAIDGDRILMGAPNKNANGLVDCGEVFEYFPFGGTSWGQSAHFFPSFPASGDRFGASIAIGGNHSWAVVGAPGYNGGRGTAYVFNYNQQLFQWVQSIALTPTGLAADAGAGSSVAMTKAGDVAVVGVPNQDLSSPNQTTHAGAAYVWFRDNNGVWQDGPILFQTTASLQHDNDNYAAALAADGGLIVAGAPNGDSVGATDCGYIAVWRRFGNTWFVDNDLFAPDRAAGDAFGSSVAVSGTTIVVGAPKAAINGHTGAGAAYVLRYVNNAWVLDGKIWASDGFSNAHFGSSVSISGNTIVVGALGSADVYVFRRIGNQQWVQDAKMDSHAPFDQFGASVAVDGSTFVVGAPGASTPDYVNAGAGYVYAVPTGPSDSCAGAFNVGQGQYHGCTINCTLDGASTCGTGAPNGPDIWYSYTASQTGSLTIDTQGSMLDTILSVHSGCPATAANTVACNDDNNYPSQLWSRVTFPVAAGSTYLIRVAGYNNLSGAYTLNIGPVAGCYANCDASTVAPVLNVNDFICFQTKFASNDPYANCDGSTTVPILNVNDFICFQTKFAAGCQ